jgi:hypothetical protein
MFSTFFKEVVRISEQDISIATLMDSGDGLPSFKEAWGIYAFSHKCIICHLQYWFTVSANESKISPLSAQDGKRLQHFSEESYS